MLAVPKSGFVFLSVPKTGSTSIQNAFAQYAQMMTVSPPSLKHLTASGFQRALEPLLANHGFPRSSYEIACIVRDPIDWTASWWRYRSRSGLEGKRHYTGDMTFDAFAEGVVSGAIRLGRQSKFVSGLDGRQAVDVLFRYENIDGCRQWLSERVGKDVKLGRANPSPEREAELSPQVREELERTFAADIELYERAT